MDAPTASKSEATITIRKKGDTLEAEATATLEVTTENVRTGAAGGTLNLHNGIAIFGDSGPNRTTTCSIHLRLIGDTLLADDGATDDSNSACGGMGVTFNGIYRRATH